MAEESAPPADVSFKGKTYKPLADGTYDVIILGTGLKECILSGLLSVKGKKVGDIMWWDNSAMMLRSLLSHSNIS